MNRYDVGDLIRCTGTFTDADGNVQDPTTVIFKMREPDGTITTYTYNVDDEAVRSSEGVYYVDVSATSHGVWSYRWAGTGTGQAAGETQFRVYDSRFD